MGISSCDSTVRWLATTLLAALLSACASQPRDQVHVTIGSGSSEYQAARSYAALYVPYAMMATAAYSDPAVLNAEDCPDPVKLVNRALAKDEADFTFHKNVHSWIANLQVRKFAIHECTFLWNVKSASSLASARLTNLAGSGQCSALSTAGSEYAAVAIIA